MADLGPQVDASGWILDETVGPTARLRQGDLIRFEENASARQQVGIIVTADCDLEQKKHARLITLVPVVTTQVILEHYLLMEDCEKKRPLIEEFAFKSFSIDRQQDRSTRLSILSQMTRCVPVNDNEVNITASKFALDIIELMPVKSYKKLMQAIQSAPRKADALRDQIRSRGDLLILPNTQGLGIAGEIAWLRHIWQVRQGDIAIRTSEVSSRPGERVARLDSPYRYRLTQLLAQVFSDIGLPNTPDQIEQFVKDVYSEA